MSFSYVVFFRLDLERKDVLALARDIGCLQKALARHRVEGDVVLPSSLGAGVLCGEEPIRAVRLATEVSVELSHRVGVGIASGDRTYASAKVLDAEIPCYVGEAINEAARLAKPARLGEVRLSAGCLPSLSDADSGLAKKFGPEQKRKVHKRMWFFHTASAVDLVSVLGLETPGARPAIEAEAATPSHDPVISDHALLLLDVQGYTGMTPARMRQAPIAVWNFVDNALRENDIRTMPRFLPGGDGGVLVMPADKRATLLSCAEAVISDAKETDYELHVAASFGPVGFVKVGDTEIPVGPEVFAADGVTDAVPANSLAVSERYLSKLGPSSARALRDRCSLVKKPAGWRYVRGRPVVTTLDAVLETLDEEDAADVWVISNRFLVLSGSEAEQRAMILTVLNSVKKRDKRSYTYVSVSDVTEAKRCEERYEKELRKLDARTRDAVWKHFRFGSLKDEPCACPAQVFARFAPRHVVAWKAGDESYRGRILGAADVREYSAASWFRIPEDEVLDLMTWISKAGMSTTK